MDEKTQEQIQQAIGYYAGTIMVENPQWVFDQEAAIKLAEEIASIYEKPSV